MKPGTLIATLFAAVLWIAPAAAGAATVVITAYATITSTTSHVPTYMTDYHSPFVVGDQITATITYDSNAAFGIVPISGNVTGYSPASGVLATSGGWTDQAFTYFNVGASDITFKGQHGDPRYASGFPYFSYTTNMSFDAAFAGLPPDQIDPSTFLTGMMTGIVAQSPFLDSSFTATIDRISVLATPVPGAALLFASGLAGLMVRARRKREAPAQSE